MARWIEPLPADVARKRAQEQEEIARWMAAHKVERVPLQIADVDVRSVIPDMRQTPGWLNNLTAK